jgi:hypothetical protein
MHEQAQFCHTELTQNHSFERSVRNMDQVPTRDPNIIKKGDIPMKRNFHLFVAVLSLAFATFACSMFGGDDVADSTHIEAPPANQPVSVQPTEATQPDRDQPAEAAEAPEYEEGNMDTASLWDMGDLQSYRCDFSVNFDGASGSDPASSSLTMSIEYTSNPPVQHTIIHLDGFDLDLEYGDLPSIEFYTMEETTYVSFGMEGGWISIPNDLDNPFSEKLISYDDFVDLPERASRKLLPENVNGVTAWHYVLDEDDFLEEFTTYNEVSGDVWIAVDGGYMVKMDVSITGTFAPDIIRHQPIDQSTMEVSFNLRDVNENFTIESPHETASTVNTPVPDEPVIYGAWARQDVPLPEDAYINTAGGDNVTAQTQLSFEEVVEFFQTQLPANGWDVGRETYAGSEMYNGLFEKGEEILTLNLVPSRIGAGKMSITITIDR